MLSEGRHLLCFAFGSTSLALMHLYFIALSLSCNFTSRSIIMLRFLVTRPSSA
jgi:hypothetical protein